MGFKISGFFFTRKKYHNIKKVLYLHSALPFKKNKSDTYAYRFFIKLPKF